MTESQIQDRINEIARTIFRLEDERLRIEAQIKSAKAEQLDMIRQLAGLSGAPRRPALDNPLIAAVAQVATDAILANESIRKRILRVLAQRGEQGATTDEVAQAIPGATVEEVRPALYDMAAKPGTVTRTGRSTWMITEKGLAAIAA